MFLELIEKNNRFLYVGCTTRANSDQTKGEFS